MDALKDMFNAEYFGHLTKELVKALPELDGDKFLKELKRDLSELSLNQRMRKVSLTLHAHLPNDFKRTVEGLKKVILNTKAGYTNLIFPDYVGLYGHNHFETSMDALKHFTVFGSSEFAIREFLKRDVHSTLKVMEQWAKDNDEQVRRLASEGSRPRLPWSFKLDAIINEPQLTQGILTTLKEDESNYVKKSVANHLNDISKDQPEYMLRLVSAWNKKNPHSAWIIKHASRSLIKKGNSQSLLLFDFEKTPKVSVKHLTLLPAKLKLGGRLKFSFDLLSHKTTTQKLVIDYIIHYKKKSGTDAPKVFKLKEVQLKPKELIHISKEQLIKDFTTRKHYAGKHRLEIQVNGKVLAAAAFDLIIKKS